MSEDIQTPLTFSEGIQFYPVMNGSPEILRLPRREGLGDVLLSVILFMIKNKLGQLHLSK